MYVTEETQKLKITVEQLEVTNAELLQKIQGLTHGITISMHMYSYLHYNRFRCS